MRDKVRAGGLTGLWLLAGCSALIDTDTSRLGGDLGADTSDTREPTNAPPTDCAAGCPDDGVACTEARCEQGRCVHVTDHARCEEDERCDARAGCVPARCQQDADCDDLDACNGAETCAPDAPEADPETGCAPGTALACDDGVGCTDDACDPRQGCVHTPNPRACDDGVACTEDACDPTAPPGTLGCSSRPRDDWCAFCASGSVCDASAGCRARLGSRPRDCSDGDPCTADLCDGARQQCVHAPRDADGDGAPAAAVPGQRCGGSDCDDRDPAVYPGATELCNGRDDDCDGTADEACLVPPDDCGSAQTLTLQGGRARVEGYLSSYQSDLTTACGRGGGRDAVFRLDLDGPADVVIDATESEAHTVIAAADSCSESAFSRRCNGTVSDTVPSGRLFLHRFPGGPLFILVDGITPEERGRFTLTVEARAPAGDRCGGSLLDISQGGVVLGSAGGGPFGTGTERGCCQPFGGDRASEALFRLTSPPDGDVELELRAERSFGLSPAIYARLGACSAGTEQLCDGTTRIERACEEVPGDGSPATVTVDASPGEALFVGVDGLSAGAGYRLHYRP